MQKTTISIEMVTKDRLKDIGKKGETYDEIINRLVDEHNRKSEAD